MDCTSFRESMVPVLERVAGEAEASALMEHLPACAGCSAEWRSLQALTARLFARAAAMPLVDLETRVAALVETRAGPRQAASPGRPPRARRRLRASLAAASLAGAVACVAAVVLLVESPRPAWALEQSIEALRAFRGLHVQGTVEGAAELDMWIRMDGDPAELRELHARVGEMTIRVADNRTYYHARGTRVAWVDDAPTAGFHPLPGPELLEFVRAAGFRELSRGVDSKTGHERVAIETSLTTGSGMQSAVLEFDTTTKLMVGLRQWSNLGRAGKPTFEATRIVYFADVPDGELPDLPRDLELRERPLEIREELLGLVAGPHLGLPARGPADAESAVRLVREVFAAVGARDWARFRMLVPVAAGWNEAALEALCVGPRVETRFAELVEVGTPVPRGSSRLGPLLVVPTRIRRNDGRLYDQKFIVQFRGPADAPSCVLYGTFGSPYRAREAP